MCLLLLAESEAGVAKTHVRKIVFQRRLDIFPAFHIITLCTLQQKRVHEIGQIAVNGIRRDPKLLFTGKCVGELVRVCQGADGRGQDIQQIVQNICLIQDGVAFHNIPQIGLFKQIPQILALLLMAVHGKHQRHPAVGAVIPPGMALVAIIHLEELRKRQRIHPDLIPAVTKLRQDIRGEHLRIAAGHVDIRVSYFHQAEHHVDKAQLRFGIIYIRVLNLRDKLDLVDHHIVLLFRIADSLPDKLVQFHRIAVSGVGQLIQRKSDELILFHTLLPQVVCIQLEQQKRLSAAPKAGNDLYSSVVLLFDQLLQILLSLNQHRHHLEKILRVGTYFPHLLLKAYHICLMITRKS